MDGDGLRWTALRLRASVSSFPGLPTRRLSQSGAAAAAGDKACAAPLAYHLVVELSLLGNTRYRQGELQSAIGCYEEAIELCTGLCCCAQGADGLPGDSGPGETFTAESQRNNLVRLRYNLARALHRTDRWSEARDQATKVLQLDPVYGNAYALRAQAAMASWDPAAPSTRLLSPPPAQVDLEGWRTEQGQGLGQPRWLPATVVGEGREGEHRQVLGGAGFGPRVLRATRGCQPRRASTAPGSSRTFVVFDLRANKNRPQCRREACKWALCAAAAAAAVCWASAAFVLPSGAATRAGAAA
ncbi:unnamed protein product [Prorocentrum cordatum]|uniref:Peptidylprolyl isomerase n=1 Tax=Prorocentrum cordatum TaxID=2364126 RepID=A0ABN9V049_9DINO|nr:unnamed protein product [Polarella glacialis]